MAVVITRFQSDGDPLGSIQKRVGGLPRKRTGDASREGFAHRQTLCPLARQRMRTSARCAYPHISHRLESSACSGV